MRVGILTFHQSKNYGSVLQAFALLETLTSMGYDAELVNFVPEVQKQEYALWKKEITSKSIILNIITMLDLKYIKRRNGEFENFFERYKLSANIYNCADMQKQNYNVIIVGSDQVWNVNAIDFDNMFLLPMKCRKKIAYAVSMGRVSQIPDVITDEQLEYIRDFDRISVREQGTKEFLERAIGKRVNVTLDPTLLVNKTKWSKLAGEIPLCKDEYFLVYSIEYYPDIVNVIHEITKKCKKKVIYIYTCKKSYYCFIKGWKKNKKCSPEDFLNYIKYAEFVFSSSFHGCVFSLIFEKNFYALERILNGEIVYEDRIRTLLTQLSLEKRIINSESVHKKIELETIDYTCVNKILEQKIEKSKNYIKEAIEK